MIERERSSKRKEVCKLVYFSFEWEGILPPASFVLQLQYLLFIGLEIQWIYPFTWTFKIACSKIKISVALTRGKGVILAKCSSRKYSYCPGHLRYHGYSVREIMDTIQKIKDCTRNQGSLRLNINPKLFILQRQVLLL